MDKQQAIHAFWAGFGLPAYDETSVPDNAELPYITHESAVSDFDRPVAQSASIWMRATSWNTLVAYENAISEVFTRGGVIIHYDGGAAILRKGSPWSQRLTSENDDTVRRIFLNYEVEYID